MMSELQKNIGIHAQEYCENEEKQIQSNWAIKKFLFRHFVCSFNFFLANL